MENKNNKDPNGAVINVGSPLHDAIKEMLLKGIKEVDIPLNDKEDENNE
jgi:hypothetical protein